MYGAYRPPGEGAAYGAAQAGQGAVGGCGDHGLEAQPPAYLAYGLDVTGTGEDGCALTALGGAVGVEHVLLGCVHGHHTGAAPRRVARRLTGAVKRAGGRSQAHA